MKALDAVALLIRKKQELHIDLDMVPRNLLFITDKFRHGAFPALLRQPIQPVPEKHVVTARPGDFDVVKTREIPANLERAKMISRAQVQDLFLYRLIGAKLRVFRARFIVD